MTIHPLSEGEFTIGFDKVFLPFDTEKDVLADRPKGSLLVEVQPFLVELGGDVILLDTGLGFTGPSGRLQIHEALERHGYGPGDVTRVLLSHLHKDHAGGLLWQDGNGAHRPAFPYAIHTIRRSEWDYAIEKGYPSYHPDDFAALADHARIEWLDGESGEVLPGIRWEHSGGHCPQHVVYLLQDGAETAFFGGDEAPEARQFRMKYAAKYDWDPKRAMALRDEYAERGRAEGWQFLFYHDIKTPVAAL